MNVTQHMAKAARQFDAIVKGDMHDILDDLKRYMIDAVSNAYDQGREDERAALLSGIPSARRRTQQDRRHTAEIRAWALANGFGVASRGRLPRSVRLAHERVDSA